MAYPLDPDARSLIGDVDDMTASFGQGDEPPSPAVLREWAQLLMDVLARPTNLPQVDVVTDEFVVSGALRVPIRRYHPSTAVSMNRTVVMMHGGGWVVGNLDNGDLLARYLAAGLDAEVISVDYRLAPEHPFPSAYEDCCAVLRSVRGESPERWVGVAGDSAGGNLAAAVALAGREDPELEVNAQLLIYPALDPSQTLPSYGKFGEGYLLTSEIMAFYWASYLQRSTDKANQHAAPFVVQDLKGAPPAVVVTAGYDPLQDEGRLYARRLLDAGGTNVYLHEPGMIHGFIDSIGRVPAAERALVRMIKAFDLVLPGSSIGSGSASTFGMHSRQPA